MKKTHLLLFALLLALALAARLAPTAVAQSAVQVSHNQAVLDYPDNLTFELKASAGSEIRQALLEYGTSAQTCVSSTARQTAKITPGSNIETSWEWDFKDSGNLPPGAQVWWRWQITTADGASFTTDQQQMTIEDDAFTWKFVENEQVRLAWAEGSQNFANELLQISTDSLERLANNAGIRPRGQVRLTIYPSFESLRAAMIFTPEWTGGIAFPEHGVSIMGIPTNSGDWADEVIPHELSHLVIGQVTFNCLGAGIPTWLEEGLAVANEGPANSNDLNRLRQELQNNRLPALRTLAGGFSANSNEATLNYAQSGAVTRFLLAEYGADKMAALLQTVKGGSLIDPALEQVYGFNTDGVDVLWRFSLGFGDGQLPPTLTPTARSTAVPTIGLATPAFGRPKTATPTPAEVGQAATPTELPTDTPAAAESSPTPLPINLDEVVKTVQTAAATAIGDNQPTPTPANEPFNITCNSGALLGLLLSLLWLYPYLIRKGQG